MDSRYKTCFQEKQRTFAPYGKKDLGKKIDNLVEAEIPSVSQGFDCRGDVGTDLEALRGGLGEGAREGRGRLIVIKEAEGLSADGDEAVRGEIVDGRDPGREQDPRAVEGAQEDLLRLVHGGQDTAGS